MKPVEALNKVILIMLCFNLAAPQSVLHADPAEMAADPSVSGPTISPEADNTNPDLARFLESGPSENEAINDSIIQPTEPDFFSDEEKELAGSIFGIVPDRKKSDVENFVCITAPCYHSKTETFFNNGNVVGYRTSIAEETYPNYTWLDANHNPINLDHNNEVPSIDETMMPSEEAVPNDTQPNESENNSVETPSLDETIQNVLNEHFPHMMVSVQRSEGVTGNGNRYDFTVYDNQNYGSASHFTSDGTFVEFEPSDEHLAEMQRQAEESAAQTIESDSQESEQTEETAEMPNDNAAPEPETDNESNDASYDDPFPAPDPDTRSANEMDEEELQEKYGPFAETIKQIEQEEADAQQTIDESANQNDGNDSSVPAPEESPQEQNNSAPAAKETTPPEVSGTSMIQEEPYDYNAAYEEAYNEALNSYLEEIESQFGEDSADDYGYGDFSWGDDSSTGSDDWSDEDYSDYEDDSDMMYGDMDYQNYSDPLNTNSGENGSESTGQMDDQNYAAPADDKPAKYDPEKAKKRREERKKEKEKEAQDKKEAEAKWWEEARERTKREQEEREAAKQRAQQEARERAAAAAAERAKNGQSK